MKVLKISPNVIIAWKKRMRARVKTISPVIIEGTCREQIVPSGEQVCSTVIKVSPIARSDRP